MYITIYKAIVHPNMHLLGMFETSYYNNSPIADSASVMLEEARKTLNALGAVGEQKSVFIHRDQEAQCFAGWDIDEANEGGLLREELEETVKELSLVIDLEDNTNIIVTLRKEIKG